MNWLKVFRGAERGGPAAWRVAWVDGARVEGFVRGPEAGIWTVRCAAVERVAKRAQRVGRIMVAVVCQRRR